MSFRAKWSIGSLAFAAFAMTALATGSWPLVAVAGVGITLFGLALATDWRSLASALRRSQTKLKQPAENYRLVGWFAMLIGLIWVAGAVSKSV